MAYVNAGFSELCTDGVFSTPSSAAIISVAPSSANTGSLITVTGSGFGATQGNGYLICKPYVPSIISWADDEITFRAAAFDGGTYDVLIVNNSGECDVSIDALTVNAISKARIETSIVSLLNADATLVNLVSTYEPAGANVPAIFSDKAPEDADPAYIVFDVTQNETDHLSVDEFTIDIDVYDRKPSGNNIKTIAKRIVYLCDYKIITDNSVYSDIRLFRSSEGYVDTNDNDVIHYNVRINARGTRKEWMSTL